MGEHEKGAVVGGAPYRSGNGLFLQVPVFRRQEERGPYEVVHGEAKLYGFLFQLRVEATR